MLFFSLSSDKNIIHQYFDSLNVLKYLRHYTLEHILGRGYAKGQSLKHIMTKGNIERAQSCTLIVQLNLPEPRAFI